MAKIALLGAAGAVGIGIGAALGGEGTPYRVIGRSDERLRREFGGDPLAEIKAWNLDDGLSVRQALAGIETAIYLIGVNYWQFELHPVLMRTVIERAQAAGVKRFDPRRLRDDYVPTGFKPYGAKTYAVKGHDYGLDLSEEDRKALIAFLKTL